MDEDISGVPPFLFLHNNTKKDCTTWPVTWPHNIEILLRVRGVVGNDDLPR